MRSSTSLLAIYDETDLQRQLLHHQIEHLGYQVVFSTSDKETLLEYFEKSKPPQALLMNAGSYWKRILPIVRKISSLYPTTSIIVYLCNESNGPTGEFIEAG